VDRARHMLCETGSPWPSQAYRLTELCIKTAETILANTSAKVSNDGKMKPCYFFENREALISRLDQLFTINLFDLSRR
jgi:hypothetical protein